jgi:hypothetical protein
MVSEILKKTKRTLGSDPAVQKRTAFPENFPAKPLLDQNRTGISGFRVLRVLKFPPPQRD